MPIVVDQIEPCRHRLEAFVRRISTQAERTEAGAQVARTGELVGVVGNGNVRRQVVARSILMADDRTEARIRQGRRRLVAGEHVVRAALVCGFAVRKRTNDGEFIRDTGQARNGFAKHIPSLGLDRLHLAAKFKRAVGLGVEGLLVSDPTRKEYVNDALGLGLDEIVVLLVRTGL